jgi:hypothetical protein
MTDFSITFLIFVAEGVIEGLIEGLGDGAWG